MNVFLRNYSNNIEISHVMKLYISPLIIYKAKNPFIILFSYFFYSGIYGTNYSITVFYGLLATEFLSES
jgi:hypothetical protein